MPRLSAGPVFIIGLHRSGTTFLYRLLGGALPLACLTAYHVLHYERLLQQHREGTAEAVRRRMEEAFGAWGMSTRGIDDVPLSAAMPEEYGWVLRRLTGSFRTRPATMPLVDEICRRLQYLSPNAAGVLQKNPWDTGRVAVLQAGFPEARFLFLQRDPVAIANSQLRVARYFGQTADPYADALFRGIPLGRSWLRLQRTARRFVGSRPYHGLALRRILIDVPRELARLEASWALVPKDRRLALEYRSLVRDPLGAVEKTAAFLGLAMKEDFALAEPKPRDPTLLLEVAAVETVFRRRLRQRGIAQSPLA